MEVNKSIFRRQADFLEKNGKYILQFTIRTKCYKNAWPLQKEGDWYYVKYRTESGKNISGYIHRSQIAVGETYITNSKEGYVNVRNEANSSSEILEKLPNGVKVTKYSQKGEWYYIKFSVKDGGALSEDYGYIHESQLANIK